MIERWTDERLDRADTVNQLVIGMGQLNQRTEKIAIAVERMTDVQLQTFKVIEGMQTNIHAMQTDIREMQAEVRGLQTENRRILDRVFEQE